MYEEDGRLLWPGSAHGRTQLSAPDLRDRGSALVYSIIRSAAQGPIVHSLALPVKRVEFSLLYFNGPLKRDCVHVTTIICEDRPATDGSPEGAVWSIHLYGFEPVAVPRPPIGPTNAEV
jgi:hypothetical protein